MTIFLSASIPLPDRNPKFFDTADVVAIRDAIKAFVQEFGPTHRIHFGGHPAVTPLISLMMKRHPEIENQRITLYQSEIYKDMFPEENFDFVQKVYTPAVADDFPSSLALMREKMLTDQVIVAGFFIGGMEGVVEEYKLLTHFQPNAKCYPIASTGGAALEIYNSGNFDTMLSRQLTYRTLFRKLSRLLP